MRIISWNCQMAYASKQEDILALQPDLLLLQECAEKHIKESGAPFAQWVGNNPHKGLGVLGFGTHTYALHALYAVLQTKEDMRYYFMRQRKKVPQIGSEA